MGGKPRHVRQANDTLRRLVCDAWPCERRRGCVGDRSGGGTPGSIPNPEVKPASADGSMRVTACESRSSPTQLAVFYWPRSLPSRPPQPAIPPTPFLNYTCCSLPDLSLWQPPRGTCAPSRRGSVPDFITAACRLIATVTGVAWEPPWARRRCALSKILQSPVAQARTRICAKPLRAPPRTIIIRGQFPPVVV